MRTENMVLNEARNVTLEAWIQEVGGEFAPMEKRPAILVLPGGGYSICSDREADPVAAAFLRAGYQAFILRYSLGAKADWPNPLEDYEQAMELIRTTENWHVDENRVAVVGFSAGGHLAACAATMAKNRPNAALLGYAALTKEITDVCHAGFPYPAECVDEDTCPCFLFATRDDNVVNIKNTLAFEQAMAEKGIAFESHIYSYGAHGFSTGERWVNSTPISGRIRGWADEAQGWLSEIWGEFRAGGFSEPECERLVNANLAKYLSAGCTIGYLKQQGDAVEELLKEPLELIREFIQKKFDGAEAAVQAIDGFRLSDALFTLQVPAEKILAWDRELKQIENKRKEGETHEK